MGNTANAPAGNGRADLNARLSFLELDEKGIASIRDLKAILSEHLPIALDGFYKKIKATPEVSKFFRNDEQIERARSAQLRHWSGISSGEINETYVANVRRVGHTHARIGLEPRWYIGGYALLLEHLIGVLIDELSPKSLLRFGQQTAQNDLKSKIVALVKAVMLDMDLSISTYIEAAEEARLKAEAEQRRIEREAEARSQEAEAERKKVEDAATAERAKVLDAITASLAELAKKNLSHRIARELPSQFERLRTDYNSATGQLDQVLQVVAQRVRNITVATEKILSAADNLSQRTQKTAAALEESAAALEETSISVTSTASSAASMKELIVRTSEKAADGGNIVHEAVGAMSKIEQSSKQIGQIIGVIDDIAFQTNLLALNAGVEAARAGEHGRGFAVVASEVRALAQRSAESAREIKNLVSAAQGNVGEGVRLVTRTGNALGEIVKAIDKVSNVVAEIAAGAQEQAHAISEVSTAVATMDRDTQENAGMAEELSSSTNVLANETSELKTLVAVFKTSSRDNSDHAPIPGQRLRIAG